MASIRRTACGVGEMTHPGLCSVFFYCLSEADCKRMSSKA